MAFGTFSIIHPGHLFYLESAKRHCDYLIVVVARDSTVKRIKGECLIPEKQRLEVVKALKPVDKAVLGYTNDMYRIIERIKPDILILGPDQEHDTEKLKKELKRRGLNPKIVRIKRMKNGRLHKSSKIVRMIRKK
ncbi:MAG: FAD synthase [Candidatus Diapherotrites archaeon]|nr:FAD synthase [Candidatus Diapherotrites archaeon]